MAFSHGIGGLDSITGVGSSDFFQFSKADFADFAALQAHMTQSGGNTVISLNASDAVTLLGVTNVDASVRAVQVRVRWRATGGSSPATRSDRGRARLENHG